MVLIVHVDVPEHCETGHILNFCDDYDSFDLVRVIDSAQCLQDQDARCFGTFGTCCTSKCNGFHKGIIVGLKYRDPNAPLHSCVAKAGDTGLVIVFVVID